jgi:hypothetical protein
MQFPAKLQPLTFLRSKAAIEELGSVLGSQVGNTGANEEIAVTGSGNRAAGLSYWQLERLKWCCAECSQRSRAYKKLALILSFTKTTWLGKPGRSMQI